MPTGLRGEMVPRRFVLLQVLEIAWAIYLAPNLSLRAETKATLTMFDPKSIEGSQVSARKGFDGFLGQQFLADRLLMVASGCCKYEALSFCGSSFPLLLAEQLIQRFVIKSNI
jgi:hypothetical protein